MAPTIGDQVFFSANGWLRRARLCEITKSGKRAVIVWTLPSNGSSRYRTLPLRKLETSFPDGQQIDGDLARLGMGANWPAPELAPALIELAKMRAADAERKAKRDAYNARQRERKAKRDAELIVEHASGAHAGARMVLCADCEKEAHAEGAHAAWLRPWSCQSCKAEAT